MAVFLLTSGFAPRAPGTATAVVQLGLAGYPDVVLRRAGDALEGQGPPISAEHVEASVTVHHGAAVETVVTKAVVEP